MNNNGANENLNSNNNINPSADQSTNNVSTTVNDVVAQPEIIESVTLTFNPITPPEDVNTNVEVTAVDNNVSVQAPVIQATYVGGENTLDSDSVVSTAVESAPTSIEVPIVVPDGVVPSSPLVDVTNGEVPTIPETPTNTEVQSVAIPSSDGGIKVSALGQLKKKRQKEAARAQAAADLDRGKISVKALIFPVVIIIILIGVISYLYLSNKKNLEELSYECSPINTSKNEVSIDVNSTIIQDLYGKVYTNIREDLAQPEWNDKMRIYLAYRQVIDNDKYDSNCNLFKPNNMEPYTCDGNFIPKAFTVDTLRHEWKMLFGEETEMPLINVKLENSCMGGYQYIPERDEFVQGFCSYQAASLFKVSKRLVEATAIRNTLILKEEVKYFENEKMHLPDYLKSGDYYYTFKLDMNYNYVLVSKTYNSKY